MGEKEITFINPRDFCKFVSNTPYPPLGIGYLASQLQKFGYKVDCVDGQILEQNEYERLIIDNKTEIVGITTTIKQMREAKRVASLVKSVNPETLVIMGGAGPNSLSTITALEDGIIDFIVRGEAEETLLWLLEALRLGISVDNIPNLVYFGNDHVLTETKATLPPQDLDKLPFPARDLFPQEAYLKRWKNNAGMTSIAIMGSRGCPFSCIFCDKTVSGRKIRYRSPINIVDEMQLLADKYQPLDDIFFYDDLFVCDPKQVKAVCDIILRRGLDIPWSAQARVDTLQQNTLEMMKQAGCRELYFGAESGSNRILRYLEKGFTREQIIKAFKLCHKVGIKPGIYLIIGTPEETDEDIDQTISLIAEIRPYLINFSYLTPFPNTRLYEETKYMLREDNDYSDWDEMITSPYQSRYLKTDPQKSHDRIYKAFQNLIDKGMEYSSLQFLCEQ